MGRSRREAMAWIVTGTALIRARGAWAAGPACPDLAQVDTACAALVARLPEAAVLAGLDDALAGGAAGRRCDDTDPDAMALAVAGARAALPTACDDPVVAETRRLLDRTAASAAIRYGRNDPTLAIHRPYRVTAFAGPQVETVTALALWQPVDTPAALDAWQAKLDALADALLGTAQALRRDAAAGCVPPQTVGRAALAAMDGFVAVPAADHPLVATLGARLDETVRAAAVTRAAATLARRVQPAMAMLRDTMATLTRAGRADAGIGVQPDGEALYAANITRAGDTDMTPGDAMRLGRDEAARVAALLDKRLAARGYRTGTLAERLAAGFAAHPGLIADDGAEGRDALRAAARDRIAAAHALLGKLVPPALAATPGLAVAGLPDVTAGGPGGSFYVAAGGTRPATLWLDDRSVYALPIPGVSPLAYRLGLPGAHLLASGAAGTARSQLARIGAWPALAAGWDGYAERLAAEQGLFARDPWGDIARLADELARAARLVVDVGIHHERWPRAQAERELVAMTGDAAPAAIDRILALPGQAVSGTLGLNRLLALRADGRTAAGKAFDPRAFHQAVLTGGARPFAAVTAAATAAGARG